MYSVKTTNKPGNIRVFIVFSKVCFFKSNQIFGTKHPKTKQLQKTIDYQTNEQSTKYLNWNMEIQSYEMFWNI